MEKITAWSPHDRYEPGDMCLYRGAAWLAIAPSQGEAPVMGALWRRLDAQEQAAAEPLRGNPNIGRTP